MFEKITNKTLFMIFLLAFSKQNATIKKLQNGTFNLCKTEVKSVGKRIVFQGVDLSIFTCFFSKTFSIILKQDYKKKAL